MARSQFSGEIAFLNDIDPRKAGGFRNAAWLRSPFSAPIWHGKFEDGVAIEIAFEVRLDDGSLLTDSKNADLLDLIKQWICIQTHPVATRHTLLHPSSARGRIHRTLAMIDYFLLSAKHFKLGEYGFQLLTQNDIRTLCAALLSSADRETSVYAWPDKLQEFLLNASDTLSDAQIATALSDEPAIGNPFLGEEQWLDLTDEQLLRVRCWLWMNNLYGEAGAKSDHAFMPQLKVISDQLYQDTLWGRESKFVPPELGFGLEDHRPQEKVRVAVRYRDRALTDARTMNGYLRSLQLLKVLAHATRLLPPDALAEIGEKASYTAADVKIVGRYKTLPEAVVFKALRSSVLFVLNHGETLIAAYLNIVKRAVDGGSTFHTVAHSPAFLECIGHDARLLGIKQWSLSETKSPFHLQPACTSDYFSQLRAHAGLLELMHVLVGAIYVCVGCVMARRNGELIDLKVGECLDASGKYLLFSNRKSGVGVHRMEEARPIPAIAVKFIRLLEKLHDGVKDTPVAPKSNRLFAYPTLNGGRLIAHTTSVYSCLDRFCDYAELSGDSADSRYYLRQHQLRRFFAVAFFWGSGFDGLDTLRWFFGHSDPVQIWRYITESIPGDIFRQVSVDFAVGRVLSKNPMAEQLSDLIAERFNTRNFSLVDRESMEYYINELMENHVVSVEPQFIVGDSGTSYRIAILVKLPGEGYGR